jgi:hypothetical protein
VADDDEVVTPMDEEERDRRRAYTQSFCDLPLLSSAPVAKWRREAEEAEARRAQERMMTTAELNAQRSAQWEQWATAIIARELAAHDRTLTEVLGQVVAEIRQQLRDEIQTAVGELRAEINVQRAAESGKLLDMPNPLRRKSDAA